MTKTLLEKMFLKHDYAVAALNIPTDLQDEIRIKADGTLKGKYDFILAFYTKKEELEKEVMKIKEALTTNGLLWIAYPKAKALQTDLNRDILHETMKNYSLDGVSLISLNDTWSAMRFKKVQYKTASKII